jgi:hypothetical protein
MRYRLLVIALLLSSGIASEVAVRPIRTNELIAGGGSCKSADLFITSMILWLRRGEPGVAFGMAKGPDTELASKYVLLVKGDPERRNPPDYDCTSYLNGNVARGGGHVEINGNRASVAYNLEVNQAGGRGEQERLTINGKAFDLGRGRVFLVDLSGTSVDVRQVKAELTKGAAAPRTTEDVEWLARGHLRQLRKVSAAVREFSK